tara:strand:+ start:44 stop:703 length:660 start_codon:yes stop_codon:yes gene_type:complete
MNDNTIFLSHYIDNSTPTYGNKSKVEIKQTSSIKSGDTANGYSFSISSNHIGTHIDLPSHFYDCEKNISFYNSNTWIFDNVFLLDIETLKPKLIDINVDKINKETELLLIRTGYEQFRHLDKYWELYPSLKYSFIKNIKCRCSKLRAIGFDFISLTSPIDKNEGKICHLELLKPEEEIFIIEDMKLSKINRNIKKVIVCPWLIKKMDSSPVTVIAELEH